MMGLKNIIESGIKTPNNNHGSTHSLPNDHLGEILSLTLDWKTFKVVHWQTV